MRRKERENNFRERPNQTKLKQKKKNGGSKEGWMGVGVGEGGRRRTNDTNMQDMKEKKTQREQYKT